MRSSLALALALAGWGCGGTLGGDGGDGSDAGDTSAPDGEIPCVPRVVEVSSTCARKADGTLWCWGRNDFGNLGDGTTQNRPSPVQVTALGTSVAQVAASRYHACVRKMDGTLWCWGANGVGAVGDGTMQDRLVPVQVAALGTNVADVAVATGRSCARKTDGTLWCWGDNFYGAVGDGTMQDRLVPVQVATLGAGVAQVSMGGTHTCARKTDGTVWCWGRNAEGELGDGTTQNRSAPLQVAAVGTNATQISAGGHRTYARKMDGTFWCWGSGWFGDGPDHLFPSGPVQVATLGPSVADVSVGGAHTCSHKIDGTLWCWGQNDYGALGDGTTENRGTPVQVTALGTSVAQVSAGDAHGLTCARKMDGTVWCWGDNTKGNVGDGTMAGSACAQYPDGGVSGWCRLTPVKVVGLCP